MFQSIDQNLKPKVAKGLGSAVVLYCTPLLHLLCCILQPKPHTSNFTMAACWFTAYDFSKMLCKLPSSRPRNGLAPLGKLLLKILGPTKYGIGFKPDGGSTSP